MAPHSNQIVADKVVTIFVSLIEQKSSIHKVQSRNPLLGQPVSLGITLDNSLSFLGKLLLHREEPRQDLLFPDVASH